MSNTTDESVTSLFVAGKGGYIRAILTLARRGLP